MSKKKAPATGGVLVALTESLNQLQQQEEQNIESVPDRPDIKSAAEVVKHQNDKLELENRDLRQNIELRKLYALLLFILLTIWLGAMLTVIFLTGFKYRDFELSQPVLITLITTTTGMVVGFFVGVTNYLFPSKNSVKK